MSDSPHADPAPQQPDRANARLAEERLRALADFTPALLWITERDGGCSFFSRSWYEFTGQTPEQSMGFGWLDKIHPEDLSRARHQAQEAVITQSDFQIEHRLLHHSGVWRWMECAGRPRFSDSGEFLGHAGSLTDVHEGKTAMQRLRDSEELYRRFLANSSEGVWRVEFRPPVPTSLPLEEQVQGVFASATIAECNDAFARMHEFQSGLALVGQPLAAMITPTDPEAVDFIRSLITMGYHALELESTEKHADGQVFHFATTITGVVENGLLIRAWGTQRNISERRRYEKVLLQEARRKDEFLEALAKELNSRLEPVRSALEFVGRAAQHELGLMRKREQLDRQVRQLTAVINELQVMSTARKAYEAANSETRFPSVASQANASHLATVDARAEPVRLVQAVMGLLTKAVDVVVGANEESLRLSEEKSRFLAAASHDLRQPLHALALAADMLESKLKGGPHADAVDFLQTSLAALTNSLDGMLDLSRLDAGAIPMQPQPVALSELFAELHHRFNAFANGRNLALRFAHREAVVMTDRQLLLRLLSNLIDNALKYTDHGGVLVAARRRNRGSGQERIDIEVRDSGIGISAEHQTRVFEEFYQVGNAERATGRGLGLGLAIVQRLANLMETRLQLRSAPGRGTTVVLGCRAAQTLHVPLEAPPPAPEADESQWHALKGARVLAVDNEPAILQMVGSLLGSYGVHVDVAADSRSAKALVQNKGPYELALIDYRLDEGPSGAHLALELQSLQAGPLVFILVTGDTSSREIRAMRRLGTAVLFKPLRAKPLLAAVNEMLVYSRHQASSTTPRPGSMLMLPGR